MIAVQKLSFTYPNGERRVLKNIGFALSDHGLTALLGCNGAGKTTLFRCMLALETRYEGSILLDGREIRSYTPSELAGRIAHIPQIHYPGFNYSVRDMVLMGTTHQIGVFASPGQQQLRNAQEALEKLGIAHLANRGYTRLSGGEKQLVLIARALAQQAKILLMDEPTSALDFGNQNRVMKTLKELSRKDYCVLMSTHNPQHTLSFCDRVIAMADGCVCADGIPSEVMNGDLMQRLYSIPVGFADTPYGRIVLPKA